MFRWQNIMRFVNKETLLEAHAKQSRRKATGVDGVTKDSTMSISTGKSTDYLSE